jgi:UDP-glucuronate 4-epimerase
MAINQFIRNIAENSPITLYGDGSSRRDYTYIDDIVQGVEQAALHVKGYEIINLGESQTTSLLELVRMIEAELGRKAAIQWKPMQAGDVAATYADIAKARTLLSYEPQYSMHEGIRRSCSAAKVPALLQ